MKRLSKIVQQTVVYELSDCLLPGGGGLGVRVFGDAMLVAIILGSHWEARQL